MDRSGLRKGPLPSPPVGGTGRTAAILSVDVGGTKTRALLAAVRRGRAVPLWEVETVLAGKAALGRFIREVLREDIPAKCAVAFAGPLRGRAEARMTNWTGNPVIRLGDLSAWGLPEKHTLMLNDLEAAACGVLALDEGGLAWSSLRALHRPGGARTAGGGNRVVLAPGTGLGTASIVGGAPLASEIQHADASPLDDRHAALIARFAREEGRAPSWEDFVSGRGLVLTYRALRALDGFSADGEALEGGPADPAGAVARAAARDPFAHEALDYYYGCAGRAAQLLALAVQPAGGIILCGSTTARNALFIRKSRFLTELHANAAQGPLLRRFPVFLAEADLNLRGGLWACRHAEIFPRP